MTQTVTPNGSQKMESHVISWITNAKFQVIFALIALCIILFYDISNYFFHPYDGIDLDSEFGGRIMMVYSGGPANKAGIQVGDQILAIDGQTLDPWLMRPLFKPGISAGANLVYTVQRANQVLDIPLKIGSRFDNWNLLAPIIGIQFLSVVFWGIGLLLTLFVKTTDIRARLVGLCWLLAGIAMAAGGSGIDAHIWGADPIMETAWCILGFTVIAAHLYFPTMALSQSWRTWVIRSFTLVSIVIAAVNLIEDLILKPLSLSLLRYGIFVSEIINWFFLLSILTSVGLLFRNRFRASTPEVKRQTSIVLWGMILGFSPFFVFTLVPILLFGTGSAYVDGNITILFLVLLPIAYVYVIHQRKLLRIDFIINQIVVLFVSTLLVLFLSFSFLGVLTLIFKLPSELPLLGGLMSLLVFFPSATLHRAVQEQVDRALYGSHYDYSTVTAILSSQLAQALDRNTLTQLLTQILAQQMGIQRIALLLLEGDRLSEQGPDPQRFSVPMVDELCLTLLQIHTPVRTQLLQSSLPGSVIARWHEFEWAQLFAPLIFKDELNGFLILGSRISGDVYSDQDINIIAAVTQQGALAFATIQLVEALHGLNQQLVRVDEAHRKKIARDLHDTVLQDLFFIKQRMLKISPNPELGTMMDSVILHLRQTIETQRPSLLESGISLALQHLLEDMRPLAGQAGPVITWHCSLNNDLTLTEEQSTSIYRIAQEALTNALKHASASHISLSLDKESDILKLCIEDNGHGFQNERRSNLSTNQHFGFINMQERAAMIDGKLQISSKKNKGTSVELLVKV